MADPTPEQLLAEAKTRYHLLVTGQAARVVVDQSGDRVEYTGASSATLLEYIRSQDPAFLANPTASRSRPFKFIF